MQLPIQILFVGTVWLFSFSALLAMIAKKWPALLALSEHHITPKRSLIPAHILNLISFEAILRKSLLKLHIIIMKAENKTAALIERTKHKPEKRQSASAVRRQDGYWENLKKNKKSVR